MEPFTVAVRPRYSEVDGMGIVYHANYLVYFDEDLRLRVWLSALGRASLTFQYHLHLDGTTLVTGHTRLGCIDTSYRPVGLPNATVACLRQGSPPAFNPSEDL